MYNLSLVCGDGEIGRRTRFRSWRPLRACRFKSGSPHQVSEPGVLLRGISGSFLMYAGLFPPVPAFPPSSRAFHSGKIPVSVGFLCDFWVHQYPVWYWKTTEKFLIGTCFWMKSISRLTIILCFNKYLIENTAGSQGHKSFSTKILTSGLGLSE